MSSGQMAVNPQKNGFAAIFHLMRFLGGYLYAPEPDSCKSTGICYNIKKGEGGMSDMDIQWHPGFVAAMNLELAGDRENLVYEKEYNLNVKPLEIDLLVIKKDRKLQIANETGRLFRGHNIMEYKSPDDHLDIDTFYKSEAYACLYKAYGERVDERAADDITVSIVRDRKPEGLFEYFREHGIRMENPYCGIYYVMDGVLFPTQIIVTKELDKGSHIWLKALSNKMEKQDMRELLGCIDSLTEKSDRELADAVLEISVRANQKIVDELKGENSMCQALLEIMEPEINKIVEEAVHEAVHEVTRKSVLGTVESLRDFGIDDKQIKEAIMKNYNLSSEEAEGYLV